MIQVGALDAIRAGRDGVHITSHGRLFEATGVRYGLLIETRHLDGTPGPTISAEDCSALERTYESADEQDFSRLFCGFCGGSLRPSEVVYGSCADCVERAR